MGNMFGRGFESHQLHEGLNPSKKARLKSIDWRAFLLTITNWLVSAIDGN